MAYTEFLKGLLRPLGLYDLEEGIGAEELRVIGDQMDLVFEALEELGRELFPAEAEGYGLRRYEEVLPYKPASLTLEDERRALMSLLRIRGGCFTLERLQETLSGCGLEAEIAEAGEPLTTLISFPKNRGIPPGFEELKKRIETIVPCHLQVHYVYIYSSWRELMEKLGSWAEIQQRAKSWRELEIFE